MRLALLAAAMFAASCPTRAETQVDLQLVLAVDVSFSIGGREQDIQRRGHAEAFADPAVQQALFSGPRGRIAVAYVEWAGADFQRIVAPWTLIAGRDDAARFADALTTAPMVRSGRTSLSAALGFARDMFAASPYAGGRKVVDISGDGYNNDGGRVDTARDALVAEGMTVNGLPLPPPGGDASRFAGWFAACVTGGPGAFVMPVASWDDFPAAIRLKLQNEIAGVQPARVWRAAAAPAADCLEGEKAERRNYIRQLDDLTDGHPERWLPRERDWPTPR